MSIEYEVKLAGERDALLAALETVGAVSDGPRTLEDDLVLDTPGNRLQHAGEFLRLRRRDGRYLPTFKGRQQPEAAHKARLELQTPVDDGPAMLALLQQLGFVVALRYQKYRTIFRCPGDGCARVVVSLDETPIITSAVGWVSSTTVKVAVPSASVVTSPAVGVTVMPGSRGGGGAAEPPQTWNQASLPSSEPPL